MTLTDWLLASVLSTSSVDCPWLMCRRKRVVPLLIFLDGVYSLEVLSDMLMRIYLLHLEIGSFMDLWRKDEYSLVVRIIQKVSEKDISVADFIRSYLQKLKIPGYSTFHL